MALLTEEVGELARIIARTYGEQSFKESDKDRELGDEMADVLFVLICLANQTGVNLSDALAKILQRKQCVIRRGIQEMINYDKFCGLLIAFNSKGLAF